MLMEKADVDIMLRACCAAFKRKVFKPQVLRLKLCLNKSHIISMPSSA